MARSDTDLTGSWYVSTDELDPIMADTNFFTFMQQIEGTPHNLVHGGVGGRWAATVRPWILSFGRTTAWSIIAGPNGTSTWEMTIRMTRRGLIMSIVTS